MKKVIIAAAFILLAGVVFGQGKFTVPELSFEQKHDRTNSQIPVFLAAGINFAKTQDVTPYEYGKKIGKLFAPTWDKEAGFDGYVNGMIYIIESSRTTDDGPIEIKENDDGSVTIIRNQGRMSKYGDTYATFEERCECMTGIAEQIADYMGCTITREDTKQSSKITIKKK
jgi:hypothetical protein